MQHDFTLHGSPHLQFNYKVALLSPLCGVPFAFRYVSFRTDVHRSPDFLALNPPGQVPVVRRGERVLSQSAAILLYLADMLGRFDVADLDAGSSSGSNFSGTRTASDPLCIDATISSSGPPGCCRVLPIPFWWHITRELAEIALAVLDARLDGGISSSWATRRRLPTSRASARLNAPTLRGLIFTAQPQLGEVRTAVRASWLSLLQLADVAIARAAQRELIDALPQAMRARTAVGLGPYAGASVRTLTFGANGRPNRCEPKATQ